MKLSKILSALLIAAFAILPTSQVFAAPPPDTISVASSSVSSGTLSVSGNATSNDANIGSNYTVSANWGDGSATTTDIAIAQVTSKSGTWTASHSYATNGTFTAKFYLVRKTDNVSVTSNSSIVTVTDAPKQNPVITWATPGAITYGTALSSSQLNATANIPGTLTYSPDFGAILDAAPSGTTLSVHFVPTDTTAYNTADKTVNLIINKASQTINWDAPATIIQGTALDSVQLNATTTVVGPAAAGEITYSPAAGTVLSVGPHTLTANAASTPNYNFASKSVTIQVLPGPVAKVSISADAASKEAPGTIHLTITLRDANGNLVADGTDATLTSTFGDVTGSGTSVNGVIHRDLAASTVGAATLSVDGLETSGTTEVSFVDTTAPVIQINGANPLYMWIHGTFSDPGASSTDAVDGDLSAGITTESTVDTEKLGTYSVTYTSVDSHENTSKATRTVIVVDEENPIISLNGDSTMYVEAGGAFTDPGATASDNADGDLTPAILITGTVDPMILGTTTLTYTVTDSSENTASVVRTVVVRDTVKPELTLLGDTSMSLKVGGTFTEPGYTASDSFDMTVTASSTVVTGTVDGSTAGTYVIHYSVKDASGNESTADRTVVVHELSSDASLASLAVSSGTLSPAFASSTFAYTVTLPFDATTTPDLAYTLTDPFAAATSTPAINVASTSTPDRVSTILVTAENGSTTQSYTVTFERSTAPEPSPTPSPTPTPTSNNFENGVSGGGILPQGPAPRVAGAFVSDEPEETGTPSDLIFEDETAPLTDDATTTEELTEATTTPDIALASASTTSENDGALLAAAGTSSGAWWKILIALAVLALLFWIFFWRRRDEQAG